MHLAVAIAELRKTGKFSNLAYKDDEAEHSIEMHLPYVRKVFEGWGLGCVLRVSANDTTRSGRTSRLFPSWLVPSTSGPRRNTANSWRLS